MIELTKEQLPVLDDAPQPTIAVDPRSGQEYLLIRRDVYDKMKSILKPFNRNWDNPADDDFIRRDA